MIYRIVFKRISRCSKNPYSSFIIIVDDIIRILGKYDGTKKYETVSGAEAEVPYFKLMIYHILEEK